MDKNQNNSMENCHSVCLNRDHIDDMTNLAEDNFDAYAVFMFIIKRMGADNTLHTTMKDLEGALNRGEKALSEAIGYLESEGLLGMDGKGQRVVCHVSPYVVQPSYMGADGELPVLFEDALKLAASKAIEEAVAKRDAEIESRGLGAKTKNYFGKGFEEKLKRSILANTEALVRRHNNSADTCLTGKWAAPAKLHFSQIAQIIAEIYDVTYMIPTEEEKKDYEEDGLEAEEGLGIAVREHHAEFIHMDEETFRMVAMQYDCTMTDGEFQSCMSIVKSMAYAKTTSIAAEGSCICDAETASRIHEAEMEREKGFTNKPVPTAPEDQPGVKGGKIYTHDIAAMITEIFENVLSRYNIHVPSPEDGDREEDNMIGLYGSTYSEILDSTEAEIVQALKHAGVSEGRYVTDEFSGNY